MDRDGAAPLVLLVDDVPDNVDMYTQYLEFEGYRVIAAGNGVDGIRAAREQAPDIILMDLSMPLFDGWGATVTLKTDSLTSKIPLLILTGHAMSTTRANIERLGAEACLTKPCLPEDLVRAIRRYIP
jgi:two-component system cell cycle response regulator DivK